MRVRLIPLAFVLAFVGCSKLHEQRSFTVDAGGNHSLQISAPVSSQTVTVALTSDQPVNVWVVLEKAVGGKEEFDPETLKEGVLAKEKNTKEATVTATVPAKEAFRIYVNGATKKASVSVKIDGK